MGSILGASKKSEYVETKAVEAPAPAVAVDAAPIAEISTGSATIATQDEIRRKYRPTSRALGSSGLGLTV